VHRVGRTGRAGEQGTALSLLVESERHRLDSISALRGEPPALADIESLADSGGSLPAPDNVTLCIAGGRKDKLRPGDILGALTGSAGISAGAVGRIDLEDHSSYVAVERSLADTALGRLLNGRIKGRHFKVRKL
jgi:ATP-independent RNA helicase DbpA